NAAPVTGHFMISCVFSYPLNDTTGRWKLLLEAERRYYQSPGLADCREAGLLDLLHHRQKFWVLKLERLPRYVAVVQHGCSWLAGPRNLAGAAESGNQRAFILDSEYSHNDKAASISSATSVLEPVANSSVNRSSPSWLSFPVAQTPLTTHLKSGGERFSRTH